MNLLGIGTIVETIGKVADDLVTSDEERLKVALQEKQIDAALVTAQIEVNKEEAKHSNVFVAGWRPAIGWICGVALAYAAVVEPVLRFVSKVYFDYDGDFPVIDTDLTLQILAGILGLAGMRSFDKVKKTAR